MLHCRELSSQSGKNENRKEGTPDGPNFIYLDSLLSRVPSCQIKADTETPKMNKFGATLTKGLPCPVLPPERIPGPFGTQF